MNKKLLSLLLAAVLLLGMTVGCSKAPAVLSSVGEEIIVDVQTGTADDDADDEDRDEDEDAVATAGKTGDKDADKTEKKDGKMTTTTAKNVSSTTTRTRERRTTTLAPTTTAKPTTTRTFRTTVKRTYPATEDIVVTCAGDSITANGYWQSNMQSCLSDRYTVKGYGVSGSTAMLAGYDNGTPKAYMDQLEYGNSRMSNPDIVVIMLGTNDAKDYNWEIAENENGANFKESLIELVVAYQDLKSAPTVILATPPKIFRGDIEWVPEYIPDEINPIIREVAELTGCRVADVYAATENINRYPDFSDGIHPSTENGRKIIAQAIADVIKAETGVA